MTEEMIANEVSVKAARQHIREAGRYVIVLAALIAVDAGLSYLREAYEVGGYARIALLVGAIVLFLAQLGNALAVISKLDDAGSVAWQIPRFRNILAAGMIVASVFLAGFAYVHYTGASEPFAEQVEVAQEERQAALEAAAAADDPAVIEENVEAASAAESDLKRYDLYNKFWRFGPAMLSLIGAGICFLKGLDGLFTTPQPFEEPLRAGTAVLKGLDGLFTTPQLEVAQTDA